VLLAVVAEPVLGHLVAVLVVVDTPTLRIVKVLRAKFRELKPALLSRIICHVIEYGIDQDFEPKLVCLVDQSNEFGLIAQWTLDDS
jgi:hypothetical protein